jgi:ketosteroid isomerase-like protein
MTDSQLIALSEGYFSALDSKDLSGTLAYFTADATFTIASDDTVYRGRDTEIRAMLERLYKRYAGVWHGEFQHVVQAPSRIASRFRVRNTTHQGEYLYKNNCNFFRVRDGLFDEVLVYMSGENSLT